MRSLSPEEPFVIKISKIYAALVIGALAAPAFATAATLNSFRVCADPGNMPLSNQQREGFENKIAEVIGKALGTGVEYYWRPSIERGLMRTTLSQGDCDLWMDMTSDTEGAEITVPLYRSTFVLVSREDRHLHIESFDDPELKKIRLGVFQISAIREALSAHGVQDNTVVHYLSYDGDLVPKKQPSYQVKQVIDGTLDAAAVWGPMAGYYKTVEHAPLVIQPVNVFKGTIPLEFDMSLAVAKGRPEVKSAVENAMRQNKAAIHQILVDYGVPLVRCDECIVNGDLPSHGPYPTTWSQKSSDHPERTGVTIAQLKEWLAGGAKPDDELDDAIVADDMVRVRYLLDHGANPNSHNGNGYTPLVNATRFGFAPIATYLVEHKADVNLADQSSWTPLMYAAWNDDGDLVRMLVSKGAKLDATDSKGLTPLAIAAQNAKLKAAAALVDVGANVNVAVGGGGYTPLMLAATSGSTDDVKLLLKHGAKVNETNAGKVTALMIAAAGNHPEMVTVLLDAGADPGVKSGDGRNALSIARTNNYEAVVTLLEQAKPRHQ